MEYMANIPRVEITEKALKILKIETALSGLGQKGTLEALVIRGASAQSLALMEEKAIIPKVESMPLMEVEEKEINPKIPRVPIRKVSAALKNQPAKIVQIKEIWATGERNRAEIARMVGITPDDSVVRWIAAALKMGDLKE
jgi:hypothetical protein